MFVRFDQDAFLDQLVDLGEDSRLTGGWAQAEDKVVGDAALVSFAVGELAGCVDGVEEASVVRIAGTRGCGRVLWSGAVVG